MLSSVKLFNGCINCASFRTFCLKMEGRMLKKILEKQNKKLKNSVSGHLMKQLFPDSSSSNKDRKTISLNKIWMESISGVLAMGYENELADLEIEISKVRVIKSPTIIDVYWISKNHNVDEKKVLEFFNRVRGNLKESASQTIGGKMPEFRFIRDTFLEKQKEVINLLSVIDVGKSDEPAPPPIDFDEEYDDQEISDMRQNLFGLDYAKIKKRILDEMEKCRWASLSEFSARDREDNVEENDTRKFIPFNKSIFRKYHRRSINLRMYKDKFSNPIPIEKKFVLSDDNVNDNDDEDDNVSIQVDDDFIPDDFEDSITHEDDLIFDDGDDYDAKDDNCADDYGDKDDNCNGDYDDKDNSCDDIDDNCDDNSKQVINNNK